MGSDSRFLRYSVASGGTVDSFEWCATMSIQGQNVDSKKEIAIESSRQATALQTYKKIYLNRIVAVPTLQIGMVGVT